MFDLLNNKTYRLLFILGIIVTLILTLSIPVGLVKSGLINDKVAHAVTFSVLAFLYSHTLDKNYGFQALVLLAAFGFLIELIQYFLPWRSFSWLDWVADLVGIFVYEIIHRVKRVLLTRTVKRDSLED